eukprot:3004994-Amphidinium_carterae.2
MAIQRSNTEHNFSKLTNTALAYRHIAQWSVSSRKVCSTDVLQEHGVAFAMKPKTGALCSDERNHAKQCAACILDELKTC